MGCSQISENRSCHSTECRKASQGQFQNLTETVQSYITHCRPEHVKEMSYFSEPKEILALIERAVLSKLWNYKIAPHQRRIGTAKLEAALPEYKKVHAELEKAESFEVIHKLIEKVSTKINGIGKLATYDISTRIAAGRNIYPEKLYIHAGVETGIKFLGYSNKNTISLSQIFIDYPEMKSLNAGDLENFICIFKDQLARFNKLSTPPK